MDNARSSYVDKAGTSGMAWNHSGYRRYWLLEGEQVAARVSVFSVSTWILNRSFTVYSLRVSTTIEKDKAK